MSGFDFDKAFDECAKIVQPVIPLGDRWTMPTLMGKDGARALVTEALEAFLADLGARAAFRYRDEHQGLEYAMATARALIPKHPAPPDPMKEYVKLLEDVARRACGSDYPCRCGLCVHCTAKAVLASKPKEAQS